MLTPWKLNQPIPMCAPDDDAGGGTPPANPGEGGTPHAEVDFSEYLKSQPKEVQEAHARHEAGLRSALEKERQNATEAAKKIAEAERARQEREQQAMVEQGKFKELADAHAAKLAELEPKVATASQQLADAVARTEAAEKVVADLVEQQVKELNLPKSVVDLLAGKTPTERLAWLNENGKDFKKQGGHVPPSPNGDGGSPKTPEQKAAMVPRTW